jgi:hypothetical protein
VSLGRAATVLAWPAPLAALVRRSTRGAAALLLAPPLTQWHRRRPQVDPVSWRIAWAVDDEAYGLGVWHGCITGRTLAPLLPRRRPIQ